MRYLLLFLLLTTNAWSQERLVFAIDLIRHGDRTPLHTIPASPSYDWKLGPGELTLEGIRQEYQLGMRLRRQYVNRDHFLPLHYDRQVIEVRSTDTNRTLMSAQAVLKGLYPWNRWPVPIHFFVPTQDHVELKNLAIQYVVPTPAWKAKEAQLQPYFARWSQATGEQITSIGQLASIGNTLYIDQLHDAPLPKALTSEDIKTIQAAGQWVLTAVHQPEEIGRALGCPTLKVIADYLKAAAPSKTPLKFVLLSAHDTTLLSVMSALRVPLTTPPGYAADLNFALYDTPEKQYKVKLSYNQQPVTLPFCGKIDCTLAQFLNYIQFCAKY